MMLPLAAAVAGVTAIVSGMQGWIQLCEYRLSTTR